MAPAAAYDQVADWYEREFLPRDAGPGRDPLGVGRVLADLLGPGGGTCLEVGCGTGVRAGLIRDLGALLHAFLDAGLHLGRFAEGAGPTPVVLGIRARPSR
jgi:hypothetical protein